MLHSIPKSPPTIIAVLWRAVYIHVVSSCFYFLTPPSIALPTMIWLSSAITPLRKCCQGHQPPLWSLFSFCSTSVVGRTMSLFKDVHTLISRECEYVTLHHTLQGMFKTKGTETGRLLELLRRAQSNPRSPTKVEEGDRRVKILFISIRWLPPPSCSNSPSLISSYSFVPMSNPIGNTVDFTSRSYSKSVYISLSLLLTLWSLPSPCPTFCNKLPPCLHTLSFILLWHMSQKATVEVKCKLDKAATVLRIPQ